ncbi:MAG: ATP-binding protein [Cyanobacteria bacterium P01_G01_bin.49]
MKRPSFRLQITLLSSVLAGTSLIGFGAISWFQIYNANVSRLDAQILNLLMRRHGPPTPERTQLYQEQRWKLYSNSLADILGVNTEISTGLLVLDAKGNRLYQSEEIIADLDLHHLLSHQLTLTKPPPRQPLRQKLPPPSPPPPPPTPPVILTTKSTKTGTWRIGTAKFSHIQMAIAVNQQVIQQEMATISQIFLISILGLFLIIAISAWLLSRSAIRPINQLTTVIQQVSAKGLDRRIPLDQIDVEFVELIRVFNQMLERLERSFNQASRFSANAAHELKTPLTIIQGELERMLHQVASGSDIQQRLGNLLDETMRLGGIMRKLLLLSLADAGQMSLYLVEVDISELLFQILEDLEILAPHLTLRTSIAKELIVKGDCDLLMQVFQNLLSNAIKYNLANGWIEVNAKQTKTTLQVIITNASKEIPPGDRTRIFDRFYRGDPSSTHNIEGIGLGLNLAREIVRAHHGELILNSTSNGETSFRVNLPMV